MPEKRLYHVAFIATSGTKLCTANESLEKVKGYIDEVTTGWASRAKSSYEFIMPNGVVIGIERQADQSNQELKSISIFEKEEIPTVRDIRYLTPEELRRYGYDTYGDFVNEFIISRDPTAYQHIVSGLFSNDDDNVLIGDLRNKFIEYIKTRPFVYYQIEWYEGEAPQNEKSDT